jgi:predicted DNA-binding transcriptional regulator AlpA
MKNADTNELPRGLLRPHEAAVYLGCSADYLHRLRKRGEGPPVVRLSAAWIAYRKADLDSWVDTHVEAPA